MTEIKVQIRRADQVADPYFYVPFDVPEGVTRIDVSMVYRKAEDCVIDLGLLDPLATDYPTTAGFRGWSGGARDHFLLRPTMRRLVTSMVRYRLARGKLCSVSTRCRLRVQMSP